MASSLVSPGARYPQSVSTQAAITRQSDRSYKPRDGSALHKRFCHEVADWYERALLQLKLPRQPADATDTDRALSLLYFTTRQLCARFRTAHRRTDADLYGLGNLLDRYQFTRTEQALTADECALDPAVPGMVFEQLLARCPAQTGATVRKQTGSFYTPRVVVNYMVDETLSAYLAAQLNGATQAHGKLHARLRDLFADKQGAHGARLHRFSAPEAAQLVAALARVRILDPACGSGAFLIGMLQKLAFILAKLDPRNVKWKRCQLRRVRAAATMADSAPPVHALNDLCTQLNNIEAVFAHNDPEYARKFFLLQHCLHGLDIQPEAVRLARWRCRLALGADQRTRSTLARAPDRPWPKLALNIVAADALRGSGQQFDIVIGNPPYLGEKGHKEIFRAAAATPLGKRFYAGKMDLFYFFFHLGLDLLKADGLLAYITTNYFVTATAAKVLRADMKARASVLRLINLNEVQLFESAHGQHNLITILRKGADQRCVAQTCITAHKGVVPPPVLAAIMAGGDPATEYFAVPQRKLYEGTANHITLRGSAARSYANLLTNVLGKMQATGTPLGQFFNVNQGIVSGADKVSPQHARAHELTAQTGTGIFVVPADYAAQLNLTTLEARVLRPWFKNSDIQRWTTADETARRVLYFDRTAKGVRKIIERLEQFRPILENRREVAHGVIQWWQLQWPRTERIFTAPKLVAPQRAGSNVFGYNESPWFASADVYFITDARADKGRLKMLLALLNSQLFFLWLYHKGKRKGELLELYQQPLAAVPLPHVSPSMAHALVRRVDRIIAALHRDPTADVRALEREIDALVYQLYALTPVEVRAVEAARTPSPSRAAGAATSADSSPSGNVARQARATLDARINPALLSRA